MTARSARPKVSPATPPVGGSQDGLIEGQLVVELVMEGDAWQTIAGLDEAVEIAARHAYRRASPRPGQAAAVTVALLGDADVRALNRQFRGQDKPTNVLSFPALALSGAGPAQATDAPPALGDLALAYETIAAEARAEDIAVIDHVRHLVVHGTLHLLGFDHETDADADRMEALETSILAELGVADPYRH